MLHAARAANEEVRSRLASASLDAIAPLSTLVSLLLVLLVGASLDGHEWLRGTSMHLGQPQDALVSLGSVRFGEPSGHGIHFARPTALKRLCVDEGAPLPPRALHAAETDQAIWCAVARAGSTAQSLLWLGYLPLWATAALSAILWLSASVEAARSVRFALAAAGLSDGLFAALLLLGWALSWSFLFAALCAYAHHAPPSLGWASVSLEASFGLLRLAFLVSTLAACALVAKALSLWDDEGAAQLWAELLQASLRRRALYAVLCAQLLLLFLGAVRRLEWQALVPLLGLHHLDNGKASVLLAYCALTALSLLTDAYTLGALPDWAGTSGAQAFGGSCYLMAALLKPAALVGMALVHRQEDADRRRLYDENAEGSAQGTGGQPYPPSDGDAL